MPLIGDAFSFTAARLYNRTTKRILEAHQNTGGHGPELPETRTMPPPTRYMLFDFRISRDLKIYRRLLTRRTTPGSGSVPK